MTPAEHAKAIERAVEIYSRDFAIYCDTQALTDFRVCSVSLATLQAAIQAGVGAAANAAAPAQAARWSLGQQITDEMRDAAEKVFFDPETSNYELPQQMLDAMLAAAPRMGPTISLAAGALELDRLLATGEGLGTDDVQRVLCGAGNSLSI